MTSWLCFLAYSGYVRGMAIDALTGNVYYGDSAGNRLVVCNSEVENCVALTTTVSSPHGITVHFQQRYIH